MSEQELGPDEIPGDWVAYQNLVQKVLNELFFQRSRCEKSVQIGPQEFSHKIAAEKVRILCGTRAPCFHIHVLKWRDEDVAQRNDLGLSVLTAKNTLGLTFSCRRCFSSFNSR